MQKKIPTFVTYNFHIFFQLLGKIGRLHFGSGMYSMGIIKNFQLSHDRANQHGLILKLESYFKLQETKDIRNKLKDRL